ncbi:MAG: dephospho-CoA kinase [Elusimicrobia bacterium GWA2_69_24]|nr:MAG: dephospho-CoA kinase [Elusimicrobia bacterium GWA2_69_24]
MLKGPRPLRIGLTGGIGSGKSAALEAFGRAGADTVSLDAAAHELSRRGGPIHRAVRRVFGPRFFTRDGELDRRALGAHVFSRPAARRRLEAVTHPLIRRELRRRLELCRARVAVVDVPLLFEGGLQARFDLSVVVSAPLPLRLRRVMRRDGLDAPAVRRRVAAQLPLERKEALADIVIRNDGSLDRLRRRVRECQDAFDLIARTQKPSGR